MGASDPRSLTTASSCEFESSLKKTEYSRSPKTRYAGCRCRGAAALINTKLAASGDLLQSQRT